MRPNSSSTVGRVIAVVRSVCGASLLGALCVASMAVPPATAEPRGGIGEARGEVRELSDSLVASGRRRAQLEVASRALSAEAERLGGRAAAGRARLVRLEGVVARSRREARSAGRKLSSARDRLANRLAAVYMAGSSGAVSVLLSATDFGDLVSGEGYLSSILDFDRTLAARIAQLRSQRLSALDRAEATRDAIGSELLAIEEARRGALAASQGAESNAERLASIDRARRGEIARLRQEIESLQQASPAGAGASFHGGPYSIPTYIVMCESGGNYSALNPSSGAGGAYQIIPSTWEAYGGDGLPHLASKAEQDRIARLIWEDVGPSAWVCA